MQICRTKAGESGEDDDTPPIPHSRYQARREADLVYPRSSWGRCYRNGSSLDDRKGFNLVWRSTNISYSGMAAWSINARLSCEELLVGVLYTIIAGVYPPDTS